MPCVCRHMCVWASPAAAQPRIAARHGGIARCASSATTWTCVRAKQVLYRQYSSGVDAVLLLVRLMAARIMLLCSSKRSREGE